MAIKLKNSIRYELLIVTAWILWSVLFLMTKGLFTGMEIFTEAELQGAQLYLLIRALVFGGAVSSVILGGVLVWASVKYLLSARKESEYSAILPDKIPTELLILFLLWFWYRWRGHFFSSAAYDWLSEYYYNGYYHQLYYLLYNFLRMVRDIALTSAGLCVSLWLLLRQICYRTWPEHSFLAGRWKIYRFSSVPGKRIAKRQFMIILCMAVSVLAGILALGFAYEEEPGAMLFFAGICALGLFGIIILLGVSGITSVGIYALVEQIRAISNAEPLNEAFRLSEKSLFYEPFHQLEELDAAVKRSAEKQLQAERLKIDLITNVSHDLKTPLTSMVGYTDLLKQEELSDEAKDYVEIISQKQEQLKEMIQQLFELSKATSGVEQLKLETLDMRKLVEQIIGDMDDRIQESGQMIRSSFEDSSLLFTGDNEKMYRVVQNLLENALKYSLENTRIYITVKKENNQICLTIKNIASYEMNFAADEITERFVRGDQSRSTEGHGLGLAIASSFTQNMGGTLLVDVDGDLFKVTVEFPGL